MGIISLNFRETTSHMFEETATKLTLHRLFTGQCPTMSKRDPKHENKKKTRPVFVKGETVWKMQNKCDIAFFCFLFRRGAEVIEDKKCKSMQVVAVLHL